MARCPNRGENTSGDYCQCCKYPIPKGSESGKSIAGFLLFFLIGTIGLGLAAWALWYSLTPVTPREDLKEVRGLVSNCTLKGEQETSRVELQLLGYDDTILFSEPNEKIQAVYYALRGGGNVILLVEEGQRGVGEPIAHIWEGRIKDNVFIQYEDVAEYEKSNKRWALGIGLCFLPIGGFLIWVSVHTIKG